MAFPSPGPISLKQVCDAYNVAYNMNALIGNVYFDSPTDSTTSTIIKTPVELGQFRGKYVSSTGTLQSQEAFAQDGYAGHGIEARSGFNNASYTLTNGKVTNLTLNFYLNNRATGSAISGGNNSPNITILQNGISIPAVLQDNTTGSKTVIMNATTFTISVSGNASNNWGDQASASGSWSYSVTKTGVSGP
jgi:hypothetical protein